MSDAPTVAVGNHDVLIGAVVQVCTLIAGVVTLWIQGRRTHSIVNHTADELRQENARKADVAKMELDTERAKVEKLLNENREGRL